MHKVAMEMGKWAMEKAKTHGFNNLSAQDWDDLKDCMEKQHQKTQINLCFTVRRMRQTS